VFDIQCQDSQPAASEKVELPNNEAVLQLCYERAVTLIERNRVELNTSRQTFCDPRYYRTTVGSPFPDCEMLLQSDKDMCAYISNKTVDRIS
jgi:hypothetical protein